MSQDVQELESQTGCPRVLSTKDGDVLDVGRLRIKLIHTPGHTPGSQCLLMDQFCPPKLLTGDTLFVNSIGRIGGEEGMTVTLISPSYYSHITLLSPSYHPHISLV
jgi:glyoxylase-like metal-dependent hydrolase (beta-lactamase superfamily II)